MEGNGWTGGGNLKLLCNRLVVFYGLLIMGFQVRHDGRVVLTTGCVDGEFADVLWDDERYAPSVGRWLNKPSTSSSIAKSKGSGITFRNNLGGTGDLYWKNIFNLHALLI